MKHATIDRYRGALIGLAVGDALGTTLEFKAPGTFEPISDIVGGGPFQLKPGQWTDDTSMALCLAESLIECGGFDPKDQMARYVRWWKEGHLSSNGRCFDIGNTVRDALGRFLEDGEPFAGSSHEMSAGNGCIMRLAPVPLAFAHDPDKAIHFAGESSKTTHGAEACVDACRYMAGLIVGAVHGAPKEALLSDAYRHHDLPWAHGDLHPAVYSVAVGSYRDKSSEDIRGTGYVINCLEAALWAFYASSSFEEGALLAVNLGDDADTTGAVYGQIAGAYYGFEGIPEKWTKRISMSDLILEIGKGLSSLEL